MGTVGTIIAYYRFIIKFLIRFPGKYLLVFIMARKKTKLSPAVFAVFSIAIVILGGFLFKQRSNQSACANSLSCKESLELSVNNDEQAVFAGIALMPPKIDLSKDLEETAILGTESQTGEKRIEVDLSTQTVKAYSGDSLYMEAKVSTGKWFPTPTGEFTIWRKIRATKMSGGQGADYYYLPNVPYVMFFSNAKVAGSRGFSLHGAYWHDNFGHAMSHGCVNMRTIDAKKLYEWADPPMEPDQKVSTPGESGTKIIIYGQAP